MEPFNNRREDSGSSLHSSALIPGLVMVAIGALFLLGNLHIVHVSSWVAYWPVILMAFGMVKLVDSVTSGGRIVGAILLGGGGLLLADNLGYLTFDVTDLWPLILIAIGLMMLWNRTHPGAPTWWDRPHRFAYKTKLHSRFGTGMPMSGGVHEFAIFGGSRRVVTDQDFKGGRIACVFGGINLDLTGAAMAENTAILDISTVYGGATVRIPTSWNLEVRGAGIFGGFVDRTMHPPTGPDMKHLIVRGAAVFGGVTFKN